MEQEVFGQHQKPRQWVDSEVILGIRGPRHEVDSPFWVWGIHSPSKMSSWCFKSCRSGGKVMRIWEAQRWLGVFRRDI